MKNTKETNICTVRADTKSNRKIVETASKSDACTHIHDLSLYRLGTGTSLKKWRGKISFMGQYLPS